MKFIYQSKNIYCTLEHALGTLCDNVNINKHDMVAIENEKKIYKKVVFCVTTRSFLSSFMYDGNYTT